MRKQPRKHTSMWEKTGKAVAGAVASSAATVIVAKVNGCKSSSSTARNAATAAAVAIATSIGGATMGRFVRNPIGGLMR